MIVKTPFQARGKVIVAWACILLCCMLVSCGSGQPHQETKIANENDYPISGHILYGYKHGIKVYGQYMDQAGENNAIDRKSVV